MKKIIALLIIVTLCVTISGCSNEPDQTNSSLNLSAYDVFNYQPLIKSFNEAYPNIPVNLQIISSDDMSYEEYSRQMFTELMSGKGPDVIFIDSGLMGYTDINKLIYSGAFADTTMEFEGDSSFNKDEYNKVVFDAGIFEGKRYIIPEKYNLHILLSTENMINKTGFNLSKDDTYLDFMQECVRIKNEKDIRIFNSPHYMENFIDYLALPLIDYKNKEVNLSNEKLKVATELYKEIYKQDIPFPKDNAYNLFAGCEALKNETALFENYSKHLSYSVYLMNAMIINATETPAIVPLRGISGEATARITSGFAVNNNSKNKANAVNFIKLGISDKWQENIVENPAYVVPIKNSSAKKLLEEYQNDIAINAWGMDEMDLKPLSKVFCDEYFNITQNVTNAYFQNSCGAIFFEQMQPYFKDKATYDECIKNAQEALEIYVSE